MAHGEERTRGTSGSADDPMVIVNHIVSVWQNLRRDEGICRYGIPADGVESGGSENRTDGCSHFSDSCTATYDA